jgi:hypothetical protein
MVRKVLIVVSIKVLESWFWDKAVKRFISILRIRDRFNWVVGGVGGKAD